MDSSFSALAPLSVERLPQAVTRLRWVRTTPIHGGEQRRGDRHRRHRWNAALLLGSSVCAACSATNSVEPSTAVEQPHSVPIGTPCHFENAGTRGSSSERPPRVFVEIAVVEGQIRPGGLPAQNSAPRETTWIESLLGDPNVRLTSVTHLLAEDGRATTMNWAQPWSNDPACRSDAAQSLTVVPKVVDDSTRAVSLDIDLGPSSAIAEDSPAHPGCDLRTHLALADQQTVVLAAAGTPPDVARQHTMLLTPYIIDDDQDLKALLHCKAMRAERERQ